MASYKGRDFVSISDFSKSEITDILDYARKMVPYAQGKKVTRELEGKVLALLFFEPSTRTRLSFEGAIKRLGGSSLGFAEAHASSTSKGETLADTVRMVAGYSDCVVIRHPKEGAARLAADFSDKPVINAGDGAGQHPTQTLLDLYTIKTEKKKLSGLNVTLVGDLRYGRTVHSLAHALSLFGAKLTFVSPPNLDMPREIYNRVWRKGNKPRVSTSLKDVMPETDVLYVTRIQKERFPDSAEYKKVAGIYKVNCDMLKDAKKGLIVMHPLPRVDEVDPEVDNTKHAVYFQQAFNGLVVRMAIIHLLLGGRRL